MLGHLEEVEKLYSKDTRRHGGYISTVDMISKLVELYARLGKLRDPENMHQQVLPGYEQDPGTDNITTHIPTPNTIKNLDLLFKHRANSMNTKILCTGALSRKEACP